MSKNKVFSGIIGIIIGCALFILLVDVLSKPENVSIVFKPIESFQTYFFGFVFAMGTIGWVLGSLLLIGFLALFYFLGTWVYKVI